MSFKSWSESNPKAKEELKPDLGFRSWDSLTRDEKYKVWKYLEFYFFDKDIKENDEGYCYYSFYGQVWEKDIKQARICLAISTLNQKYPVKSYATTFWQYPQLNSACSDFFRIFAEESENVVMELLSLYCQAMIIIGEDIFSVDRAFKENSWAYDNRLLDDYDKGLEIGECEDFDKFAKRLNKVFLDFGINFYLTRLGFVPRQEDKIIEEIYNPVLGYLSNEKWKEVNKLLKDAFDEYRRNTPQGYSNSVTNTISAIQAFLQILVNSRTGNGDISHLIPEAQKRNLIPGDPFTEKIFENIESIFAQERQKTGTAHPKKEYANEKNCRMILNLAMIFLQHCIER
jgi:hypothetical protein